MVLKVFLVEDEFVVRQGIKKNIAWEANGYEFCGEAGDGELALPLIRKLRPDILITDIRMPFMDGLELSRIVRKEFPETEILILSGFEEFSYAKEAIRLGVAGYLLKPISGDSLLKEVDTVAEKIRRVRCEKEMWETYRLEMQENERQERQSFFQELVGGERSVSQLLEQAGRYEMDLSAGCYDIVLVKFSADDHLPREFHNRLVQANGRLEAMDDPRILIFNRGLEGYGILLKTDSPEENLEAREKLLDVVRAIPGEFENISYAVGIGKPVNRLSELRESFEQAGRAFAHRYFNTGCCIIDEVHTGAVGQGDTELNISRLDPKALSRSRVREFLRTGDAQETRYFVEEFMENVGLSAMRSVMFRQYLLLDMYLGLVEFVEELQFSREDLPQLDMNRAMNMEVPDFRDLLIDLLEKTLAMREKAASNRYGDMVEDTIRFVEANYANPELSLNMAASYVKFSPNYLSKIFSEQTGETFIHYLTEYRMRKAKELLRCTTRKSSEIAYDVGYKDPHYFSFLFKKQTGISPRQFRDCARGIETPEGKGEDA